MLHTLRDAVRKAAIRGEVSGEVISKHKSRSHQPVDKVIPNCSPELAAVVQKMMAKNPLTDTQNFTEVIEVLQKFLDRAGKDRGPTTAQTRSFGLLQNSFMAMQGSLVAIVGDSRARSRSVAFTSSACCLDHGGSWLFDNNTRRFDSLRLP